MFYSIVALILVVYIFAQAYINFRLYNELISNDEKMDKIVSALNEYNSEIYNDEEKERFIKLTQKFIQIWNN